MIRSQTELGTRYKKLQPINTSYIGAIMKNHTVAVIIFVLSLFAIGCSSEQQVLWNLSSEKGEEIKIKVQKAQTIFDNSITIRIDDENVITGNGGTDKKTEYNAEYKGKSVKAYMIYDSTTKNETVELIIDGKLVGEFTFPK